MLTFNRILLVSAHPDDALFGAGGTIARLKRENPSCSIWSIYFAPCLEDPHNRDVVKEYLKSSKVFQIEKNILKNMARDGYIENHRQEVRDILWKIKEEFKPEIVLCPSPHDFHQDHNAIAECCLTIFRGTSTILGYEVPRSTTQYFNPIFYVIVTDEDVAIKIKAMKQYKSQRQCRAELFNSEAIKSFLSMHGIQARTTWAEVFEVLWGRI